MNRDVLTAILKKHEGLRLKPYLDTTGHSTIGWGRNLDAEGISEYEAGVLLDQDINRVVQECTSKIACFGSLDDNQQHALLDLAFNIGTVEVLHFSKMLAALERRDFETAAAELLDSKWAKQVGRRAQDVATLLRS